MQEELLEANREADFRVYAIFFEMVAGDEGAKMRVAPEDRFRDPRVTVFWDERKIAGRWYEENVTRIGQRSGEKGRIEWDAYILYGPDSVWSERPPTVLSWGRTVYNERERLKQNLLAILEDEN